MANENDSDEGRAVMPDYRGCVFAGSKDGESYGFYLPDTVVDEAGNISLTDYVVLTGDEHMALMDGQGNGKRIVFHKGGKADPGGAAAAERGCAGRADTAEA